MPHGHVLISGASFAGLATAFWMRRAGYGVTLVETAPAIREGGTPVNIKGRTIDIVRRMGLLDAIVDNRIVTDTVEVWDTPSGVCLPKRNARVRRNYTPTNRH